MHGYGVSNYMGKTNHDTLESLKQEYDSIKRDMSVINNMEVAEESKQPILAELQKQINEVKEKLHDYIDQL